MKVPFLDLSRMDSKLKVALKNKFNQLLEEGRFSGGSEVDLLESRVSEQLRSPYSIACANGTDAIELALRALGIGLGDEVIVPALTWVSTAEVVNMVGAKPVFWDIDEDGLLAKDWTNAITAKTKAVIPVHLYGKMVNMGLLVEQALKNRLFVIEDAAQAFGSSQKGKAAGTWGDVGCLSFYPTKNLGALGEAGMCLTGDSDLAKKIRLISNHGQPVRDRHVLVGRNSRIDTIQAGFLNVMLDFQPAQNIKRKYFASKYYHELADLIEIKLPNGILNEDHNAHLFVIQIENRERLRNYLLQNGIAAAIHYPSILPDMKPYKVSGEFSNSRNYSEKAISLPLNPWLKEEEIVYVINKIRAYFKP